MPDIFNASTYQASQNINQSNVSNPDVVQPPSPEVPQTQDPAAPAPQAPIENNPEPFVAVETLLHEFHSSANPFAAFSPEPKATSFDSQSSDERILLLVRQHPIFITQKISLAVLLSLLPAIIPFLPLLNAIPLSIIVVIVMAWYLGIFGYVLQTFLNW